MASPRLMKIEGDVTAFLLIDNSPTGREVITGLGDWGTTTQVEIQTQIDVMGELSPVTTFPIGGTHTSNFSVEVLVGHKAPVFITVTNYDGTNGVFLRAAPLEA